MDREDLIHQLATGAGPVRRPSLTLVTLSWLMLSALWVVGITHWLGPVRPTFIDELLHVGRFQFEIASGIAALTVCAVAAFRSAIPGALTRPLLGVAVGLMVLWLGNYLVGLASPALEPSMLGKRDHCVWETLLFGLPPAMVALAISRRLFPLKPRGTGAALALVAGLLPGLYMQIACMHSPLHTLQFHILPGAVLGALGALAAWFWQRRHTDAN